MALVRDATPTPCYDGGFVVDPETLSVVDGAVDLQHPQALLVEEWMGSHRWELPAGVLDTEVGNAASAFAEDGGWSSPAGISSSSSSSSVLTFDGHGEESCAAWIDPTDQLSCGLAPRRAAGSSTLAGGNGTASQKRPRAPAPSRHGAEQEAGTLTKKRCGSSRTATKLAKAPTATPPKELQSLAAKDKNRRERISERLRTLQELVPNGGKVDMVTMLDKAITYVKFMQLQLKVLETDAFWPTQGGEAPEMSRVKEALDAILLSSSLSQRNHH